MAQDLLSFPCCLNLHHLRSGFQSLQFLLFLLRLAVHMGRFPLDCFRRFVTHVQYLSFYVFYLCFIADLPANMITHATGSMFSSTSI